MTLVRKVILGMFVVAAVGLLGVVPAARWVYPLKYRDIIVGEARARDLDPALVAAIVFEESKFEKGSRSPAGAVGLMQLMPDTADWSAKKSGRPGLNRRLTDPAANMALGSWYFRYLLDRYGHEALALAAYNGGQRNLDKWLRGNEGLQAEKVVERIPFTETRVFVYRVRKSRGVYRWLYPELKEARN